MGQVTLHISVGRQPLPSTTTLAFHPHAEVQLIKHGAGRMLIAGQRHAFGSHSLLVIPPNVAHRFEPQPDVPWEKWLLMFLPCATETGRPPASFPRGLPHHVALGETEALEIELAMRRAIRKAGVNVCVCLECRYSKQFTLAKSVVDRGLLGELHYGEVDYYHGLGPWYAQFAWNVKQSMGGSSLLTAGCHALDVLLWIMAEPVEEVASYATKSRSPIFAPYEYPTTSVTILKFRNGKVGKVASGGAQRRRPFPLGADSGQRIRWRRNPVPWSWQPAPAPSWRPKPPADDNSMYPGRFACQLGRWRKSRQMDRDVRRLFLILILILILIRLSPD